MRGGLTGGAEREGRRSRGDGARPPTLEEKVSFLRRPETYAERPERVDTVETHMSWVFLTETHAYKLKKPIRHDVLDFRTRELRRRACQRELLLNQRLAPDIYLGVVPLTHGHGGGLRLGGSGQPVDWLVEMRRLPADRMLDRLIADGTVRRAEVEPAAAALAAFFQGARPAPVDRAAYAQRLGAGIDADRDELVRQGYGLDAAAVRRTAELQLRFLTDERVALDERVDSGRVVDGHGDLRPEHVCLCDPPAIIDCLEFSRDLRIQDAADELSFLAMECARLGAPEVGGWFLDGYRERTRDDPPPSLLRFYWRYRALRRARVAIWHLRDDGVTDVEKWRRRAAWYVSAAVEPTWPA